MRDDPVIVRPLGEILIGNAIQILASQDRTTTKRIEDRIRSAENGLHSRFRLVTARLLRLALRRDDPMIRDLYVFGSTLTDQVRPTSDLDLIIHMAERDERIERQLHGLVADISSEYRRIVEATVPTDFELVSLEIVTDQEVKEREGFAALITSLHNPGLRLEA